MAKRPKDMETKPVVDVETKEEPVKDAAVSEEAPVVAPVETKEEPAPAPKAKGERVAPDGYILKDGETKFPTYERNNQTWTEQNVYRKVTPHGTSKPSYVLVASKNSPVPRTR